MTAELLRKYLSMLTEDAGAIQITDPTQIRAATQKFAEYITGYFKDIDYPGNPADYGWKGKYWDWSESTQNGRPSVIFHIPIENNQVSEHLMNVFKNHVWSARLKYDIYVTQPALGDLPPKKTNNGKPSTYTKFWFFHLCVDKQLPPHLS